MAVIKEVFDINHKILDDRTLLIPPQEGPLTPLTLFVCTYVAKLNNLKIDFIELTKKMCENPHGCLLAINSNFGHAAQRGYENYIKTPKPPAKKHILARGRTRKAQGDNTCFNSAIEPIIRISYPGIKEGKIYKVKCFPTTGETQIPGVICSDLSDGRAVLDVFVNYLNELGVVLYNDGTAASSEIPRQVYIHSQQPKMLNYKFRIIRRSPRILINLRSLTDYMRILENTKATSKKVGDLSLTMFDKWPMVILPPYSVRETKPPTDDVKVSFRFETETRAPRINIFQEGKINILGADSVEFAENIYQYFIDLFRANWSRLVCLQPRRDSEKIKIKYVIPEYVRPPLPTMTDEELDDALDEYFAEDEYFAKDSELPINLRIMAHIDEWSDDEY